ncbi:Retrovirus-related Pol polyprotein like [Argiope bruennichi]|uniref:Retrovirus-related Pol polyprotein like n=1 Tax=Argiope bruennichi TaxID=94029 RepID=A0A8T0EPM8_ARGBR|nr:Retrovirus-related Pol polyprotein like [Argiope bruennichi]
MVIDYRNLNSQTIKDKFPLQCIDDLLERLTSFSLFCILDACQGFNQIPMDEESSRKAAFTTPDGHYEPTHLFFGLSNGPPVFQRAMSLDLGDLLWSGVSCFVDDIFFGSTDFDDVIAKLRQVLEKLLNAGVTLKLSKCEFGMSEIEYLGFVIDKDGIRPGPRELAAIAEYPVPKSKDELRRFLGLTSFFRRFITRYASVAEPLTSQRPQANGQVERINQILIPMISSSVQTESHKDWDKILPKVQRCINRSPSKSTGNPPFELLYGYTTVKLGYFPQDLLPASNEAQNYNIGDVVVVRRLPEQTLLPNSKTQAKYRGPLTIIKVLPSDTYQVTNLRTIGQGRKRQPNYTTTAHASQLKLFHLITEDEDLSVGDSEDLITSYCNDGSDENSCVENTRPTRVKRIPRHYKLLRVVQGSVVLSQLLSNFLASEETKRVLSFLFPPISSRRDRREIMVIRKQFIELLFVRNSHPASKKELAFEET